MNEDKKMLAKAQFDDLVELEFDLRAKAELVKMMTDPEWDYAWADLPSGIGRVKTLLLANGNYIQRLFGEYHLYVKKGSEAYEVFLDEWQFRAVLDDLWAQFDEEDK